MGMSLGINRGMALNNTGGAWRADVWVDSVNGNDSNDGTSLAGAVETMAAAETLALAHGNGVKIALSRGSLWAASKLDLSSLIGVDIRAVGTGQLPIIDCRRLVSSGEWSKTIGQTNVYEIEWTPTAAQSVAPSIWEDDQRLIRVASVAACDDAPGSYYASNTFSNGVPAPVYVHATDSGDPASNGREYKSVDIFSCIRAGANSRLYNVRTIGNQSNNGTIEFGRFADIAGCVFQDGTKHNMYIGSGRVRNCYSYKADKTYSVFGGSGTTAFVAYNGAGQRDPLNWDSCVVLMPDEGVTDVGGFYSHGTANAFGDVRSTDCMAFFSETAFDGAAQCDSVTITNFFAYNASRFLGQGFTDLASGEVNVDGCEWYLDKITGVYSGFLRQATLALSLEYNLSNCIMVVAGAAANDSGTDPIRSPVSGSNNVINIDHCFIIADRDLLGSATASNLDAINTTNNTDTVNLTNTLVDGFGYGSQGYGLSIDAAGGYSGDNNVWSQRRGDFDVTSRLRMVTPDVTPFVSTATAYLAAIAGQPYDEPNSVATVDWQFIGDPVSREYDLVNAPIAEEIGAGVSPNPSVDANITGYSGDGTSIVSHNAGQGWLAVQRNNSSVLGGRQTAKIAISGLTVGGLYKLVWTLRAVGAGASAHVYQDDLTTQMTTDQTPVTATGTYSANFVATAETGYITLGARNLTSATASFDDIDVFPVTQPARSPSIALSNGVGPAIAVHRPGTSPATIHAEMIALVEAL
jgi:hypothetical protein